MDGCADAAAAAVEAGEMKSAFQWRSKASVLELYMGREAALFTSMRVLPESSDDDHLVLELGMNFLSAEDMSAVLAMQMHKTVGFGMTTNMHLTRMHAEGKVLLGVKFVQSWPFLGRIRLCFVEPPYFQMTVKPLVGHGLDVTKFPGISGWLDKLMDTAFGQTLVEPNMIVIDMEKFISTPSVFYSQYWLESVRQCITLYDDALVRRWRRDLAGGAGRKRGAARRPAGDSAYRPADSERAEQCVRFCIMDVKWPKA